MTDVTDLAEARGKTKPQKNAGATTIVTLDELLSDDEVRELTAVKKRLAEMLARPDIHERDMKAISVEYRAVRVELKEAKERARASELGKRGPIGVVGGRTHDGDI